MGPLCYQDSIYAMAAVALSQLSCVGSLMQCKTSIQSILGQLYTEIFWTHLILLKPSLGRNRPLKPLAGFCQHLHLHFKFMGDPVQHQLCIIRCCALYGCISSVSKCLSNMSGFRSRHPRATGDARFRATWTKRYTQTWRNDYSQWLQAGLSALQDSTSLDTQMLKNMSSTLLCMATFPST